MTHIASCANIDAGSCEKGADRHLNRAEKSFKKLKYLLTKRNK